MAKKLTAWQILRNRFPENEYVLIQEVSDASGFSRSRSLDFMLINLWESRGLAVTGIEMKSNRSDWLRELKNPKKQESHFKYCDYFYLLTDNESVAKLEEIPVSWGWYHINEKGVLKTMKVAPKLDSEPVNRSFMCAMLRRAASKDKYVHRESVDTIVAEEVEKKLIDRNFTSEHKSKAYDVLVQRVEEFEKTSGITITSYEAPEKIGEAVRIVMNGGLAKHIQSFEYAARQVGNIHQNISDQLNELKKLKH